MAIYRARSAFTLGRTPCYGGYSGGRSRGGPTRRRRRGTAMVMMVIMSALLTGLVMTLALTSVVQSGNTRASLQLDQALQAADAAGQVAIWQFKHNNQWRQASPPNSLPTLTIGTNTFKYALTCADAGAAADLYWPFNEGSGMATADVSGHGNTGSLIGGVSWTAQGVYGNALSFDGVSGYVDAGNKPSTNILGSVTMAAWIKLNAADQDQKVGGNQDGVAGGYKMSIYGLKVEFEVRDASNLEHLNRAAPGGTIFTMGVWYHVAGVYDAKNNTIKTYVNGVLDRELDNVPANALGSTFGDFRMGREPWNNGGSTRFFNGTIEDVRVYARALSAQDIRTLADTSVHISAAATLQNPSVAYPSTSSLDFICSAPTPLPPIAPALTVGGNLPLKNATISGDVQVTGNVTGNSTSAVTGNLTYAGTYSDTNHYVTITVKGKPANPIQNISVTPPTLNYAYMLTKALSTNAGGTGKTYAFGYQANQVNLIYVNTNVTDPIIDTSQSGGTLLINGTLTLTKNATFGSSGFPAYIVCKSSVTQSGGTLTLNGGLYVNGTLAHRDCTIYGDVVVTGNVINNSSTNCTFVVSSIPWFDPRSSAPTTPQPIYYTSYHGITP